MTAFEQLGLDGAMEWTGATDLARVRPLPDVFADCPLPERVLCISLWAPYAGLCVAGVKTLETREWAWPYPPSWLVIHAAKHVDRAAERRLEKKLERVPASLREARGALLGLVYVAGPSRTLLAADEEAACFYASGRQAWPLAKATPFARPVSIPRGPQKFVRLPRAEVLRHLRGAA